MPSPEELAWAAGLFEGEGSITQSGGRARLSLKMADEHVVRRFGEIIEHGVIYGPYTYEQSDGFVRKPFWCWVCDGRAESGVVLELIGRWLSPRRMARARELDIDPQF